MAEVASQPAPAAAAPRRLNTLDIIEEQDVLRSQLANQQLLQRINERQKAAAPPATTGEAFKRNFDKYALPAFAFISAASGPYGAQGANALINVLRLREAAKAREQKLLTGSGRLAFDVVKHREGANVTLNQNKRGMQKVLSSYRKGRIDFEQYKSLMDQINTAQTQDDLTNVGAQIPIAAGAPKDSPEEIAYRAAAKIDGPVKAYETITNIEKRPRPTETEIAIKEAQLGKLRREAEGIRTPDQKDDFQLKLRTQITSESVYKDLEKIRAGFVTITEGAKRGDSIGDRALLKGAEKMTDKDSAVLPSEAQAQIDAMGLIRKFSNILNRHLKGEIFDDGIRLRFVEFANQIYGSYGERAKTVINKTYRPMAERAGVSFDELFIEPTGYVPPSGKGISIGETVAEAMANLNEQLNEWMIGRGLDPEEGAKKATDEAAAAAPQKKLPPFEFIEVTKD